MIAARPLAVLVLLWLLALPAAPADAAVCADFPNQAAAQRAHNTRDADNDGIYCESLPCPCRKPGQGGSSSNPPRPASRRPRRPARTFRGRITHVADGDTIGVRITGGRTEDVRLIGIDTPETHRPETPVECGGPQATSNMMRLAFSDPVDGDGDGLLDTDGDDGRTVTLRTDPTQDTRDRFGRLLAYVTTIAGVDLGERQIGEGWAKVFVFDSPFQRLGRYRAASRRAASARRGVWGRCGGDFHRPA